MPSCMICGTEIIDDSADETVRDTFEHLFPESIGGRKGVKGFIHRGCNSTTGSTWDTDLARQLQPLCLMFDIARQRGATPALPVVTTADERVTIGPGGQLRWTNPKFEKTTNSGGQTAYSVGARDLKEARKMLSGLKKKHPEINVEAELAEAKVQDTYLDGLVHHELNFGGSVSGRSIIKSCLAIAFANSIEWTLCNHAVPYIRDAAAEPCFGYFQERDLVSGRQPGMPLHCLAVHANPSSGLILCYAEYFGIQRIVACLGDSYTGPLMKGSYALDPRNGSEQRVRVDLSFSRSDMDEIYNYKRYSSAVMKTTADAVIGPEIKRRHDAEQRRVLSREVDKAFDNCGAAPGEMLTEEHIGKISRSVAEGMAPFVARRMRPIEPILNRKARRAQRFKNGKLKSSKQS